jgi:RimJ/RimL family protein N-acetyltransferase
VCWRGEAALVAALVSEPSASTGGFLPPDGLRSVGRVMPERLTLLPLPTLRGERVILRERRESDIGDRLRHPIDPQEEDGYGSAWRRQWDGRRYHSREQLAAGYEPGEPGCYTWPVEYEGRCIGNAGLRVDPDQHCATYTVGLCAASLRGLGLGREITRLVLSWAFGALGMHRVELQVLASNSRAIGCYLACGFRQEGIRREAERYPDGWKDFIMMAVLASEYGSAARTVPASMPGQAWQSHKGTDNQ